MFQENVEIVRRWLEAWNRGDLESLLEQVAPEFEFHTARYFSDAEPIYYGRDGFLDFWNTFRDPWTSITLEIERVEDLGDSVLALFTIEAEGRGSGVKVSLKYATIITLQDGLAVRMHAFADWGEALEAVGLSE